MQRVPDLLAFAERHDLPIISIDALIRYRASTEVLVEEVARTPLTLGAQPLAVHVYRTVFDRQVITAVVKGTIDGNEPTLVRVVKGARDKDFLASAVVPGNVISRSLELIARAPQGVFIYLPAAAGDDEDVTGAVWREVGLGSYVLNALGVRRIHLLASRELQFPGIASFGLSIETIIKET
jgi:3,4-dihydroxy 2-butanone 4-phosphate synthase/GTP cyclohydrolase II